MRDGREALAPATAGADGELASRSLAQAAEERVRAAGGATLRWEGATLSSRFQPIFSVHRGTCAGFEALIDAREDGGEKIAPDHLFSRTERASRALLDWTCRALHLRNYATVDPGDRALFINIHPEAAIRDARRGREFAGLIRYYGLFPNRVCVEILETLCSDEAALVEAVNSYREVGASIAMDDFGVGCSGFGRVIALKPDIVKIDRSLLARSMGDEESKRALPQMIEALHEAQARVAIEGIESEPEARFAIAARADYMQGNFLCPPRALVLEEGEGAAALDQLMPRRQYA
jgi:EAL domain-containing protein (putative c-di-GMP-specific phosphodiesterase class I)